MPAVNFDHVAKALKRMKRQSDGQDQRKGADSAGDFQQLTDKWNICGKKIVIFKNEQYCAGWYNAAAKMYLAIPSLRFLNKDSRIIIDDNRKEQYRNINGNKCHIKYAARNQEQRPAKPVRQYEK